MSVFRQHVAAVDNKERHDCPLVEQQKQRRIHNIDFGGYEN